MEKIFRTQKVTAVIYTVMSVVVFIYTLVFMTEYKDLFGMKLQQNSQVSFFHDIVLQTFNRQIFVFALIGIGVIVCSFFLEVFSKVPDRFSLIVIVLLLIVYCGGAVYAISNIQAVEAYYRILDIQYLHLEGLSDYQLKFTTFRVGLGIYVLQIIVCLLYGVSIVRSHVTFVKNRKKEGMGHE